MSAPFDIEAFVAQNYSGNPAGGSGLGSYTRQQYNHDYFGAAPRQAAIEQMFQRRRDEMRMAEMAAQRLETLGGEQAGYWAKQIRSDPRAALRLAEQYGGFPAIEQGIMAARQAGAMQEAISQAAGARLKPDQLRILQMYGPDGLKQYMEAIGANKGGDRRIVKGADGFSYYADTGQRVLPGVQKPKDRRDTTTDTLGRTVYVDNGEPVLPAEQDMTISRAEREKLYGRRWELMKPYEGLLNRWEQYKTTPDGAAGDFTRLQTLGKMLDEGSVVREGEAELMRVMGASSIADARRKLENMWSAQGLFTEEAREVVNTAIEASFKGNAKAFTNLYESFQSENRDRGLNQQEAIATLPFRDQYRVFREFLEGDEGGDEPAPFTKAEFQQAAQILINSSPQFQSIEDVPNEMVVDILREMKRGGL